MDISLKAFFYQQIFLILVYQASMRICQTLTFETLFSLCTFWIFQKISSLFVWCVKFQGNTMKLLWTYADKDPVYGHLKWHGTFSGARSIHMLTPLWKKPNPSHNANNRDTRQWDVTVKNVSQFCCFIFSFFFVFIYFRPPTDALFSQNKIWWDLLWISMWLKCFYRHVSLEGVRASRFNGDTECSVCVFVWSVVRYHLPRKPLVFIFTTGSSLQSNGVCVYMLWFQASCFDRISHFKVFFIVSIFCFILYEYEMSKSLRKVVFFL